jgi:hypothetical protein
LITDERSWDETDRPPPKRLGLKAKPNFGTTGLFGAASAPFASLEEPWSDHPKQTRRLVQASVRTSGATVIASKEVVDEHPAG